jgi:predicted GTPase
MCTNITVIDGKEGITATDRYIEKVLGNRSIYEVRNKMDKFFNPENKKVDC